MKIFTYGTIVAALCMGLALPTVSMALTKKGSYTADYCNQDGAACGGIAYGNGGGYTVNWTRLTARSDQQSGYNKACDGLEKKFKTNLEIKEYVQFQVPADCYYKIKIDIKSGESKDRNLVLTPGCILKLYSEGTTTSNNKIKLKDREFAKGLPQEMVDYGKANCGLK